MLGLQNGRRFWSRSWVVAIPAVPLYVAWLIWYRAAATSTTQEVVHIHNVGGIPSAIVGAAATGLSAISGLFGGPESAHGIPFNFEAGYMLLGLLIVAAVWQLRSRRPIAREIWVALALGLTFWALLGLVVTAHRPPTASRYIYPSAVFLLLIILVFVGRVRATPWVIWGTAFALFLSLVPNVIALNDEGNKLRQLARIERADLGAVELLKDDAERFGARVHVGEAVVPRSLSLAGVETASVVDDRQAQDVAMVLDADAHLRGLGVAGHVAHGLPRQLDELDGLVRIERYVGIAGEFHRDERAALELIGKRGQAGQEVDRCPGVRVEPEDEVADLLDRAVDRLDGVVDALRRRRRVRGHQLLGVLERKADGVKGLDRAVVKVLGDALTLLEDRQLPELLVHARVVDGQASMSREGLDELLVVLAEGLAAGLVGQVQIADDTPLHADRDAQEAVHDRVEGREAEASGVRRDIRDPAGPALAHDEADEPVAPGRRADGATDLIADAAGDEA